MNNRTVLQIPMSKSLKASAEAVSSDYGFSSLQEAVRLFLTQLSNRSISVSFTKQENTVRMSPQAEKRYVKIAKDTKQGKNVTKTKNLDELFSLLDS